MPIRTVIPNYATIGQEGSLVFILLHVDVGGHLLVYMKEGKLVKHSFK